MVRGRCRYKPFTIWQLEYSLNCRLRPPCGAIISEFRPRIHVAGHGGDATSPAPNVAPRSQKLRPHGAKLGAKTPFSTRPCGLLGNSYLFSSREFPTSTHHESFTGVCCRRKFQGPRISPGDFSVPPRTQQQKAHTAAKSPAKSTLFTKMVS